MPNLNPQTQTPTPQPLQTLALNPKPQPYLQPLSLHCSSFLGLPFGIRILTINWVKTQKRNCNGDYRSAPKPDILKPQIPQARSLHVACFGEAPDPVGPVRPWQSFFGVWGLEFRGGGGGGGSSSGFSFRGSVSGASGGGLRPPPRVCITSRV